MVRRGRNGSPKLDPSREISGDFPKRSPTETEQLKVHENPEGIEVFAYSSERERRGTARIRTEDGGFAIPLNVLTALDGPPIAVKPNQASPVRLGRIRDGRVFGNTYGTRLEYVL